MGIKVYLLLLSLLVLAYCRSPKYQTPRQNILGLVANSTGYYSNGTHCASALEENGQKIGVLPDNERCLFSNGTHAVTCNSRTLLGATLTIKRVYRFSIANPTGQLSFDSYNCTRK